MLDSGVPNINVKGFMVDNAQENWIAVRKTYGDGDPCVPMEGSKCKCLLHSSTNFHKITQKHNRPSLQHKHKELCKEY